MNVNTSEDYQKLIQPLNKCYITASKGTISYLQRFGFKHHGVDMVSTVGDKTVYASGNGTVMAIGLDSLFGNVVIIKYNKVYNHKTQKVQDVILRYFHGSRILVKKDQIVDRDTKIMNYGNTGRYSSGAHLHITADYDCKYYQYEPGIAANGTVIKKGNDQTVFNVMEVLHCKTSAPDYQTISGDLTSKYKNMLYINKSDLSIPKLT